MVIDSATIEIKRQGSTAELVVSRRPFAFSIKLSLEELQQLIVELTQEATAWRQAQRPDFYVILGVPRDATAKDIRRAYRRQSRQHHPDLSAENTGPEMQRLNEAYEILSDTAKRNKYDQQCA